MSSDARSTRLPTAADAGAARAGAPKATTLGRARHMLPRKVAPASALRPGWVEPWHWFLVLIAGAAAGYAWYLNHEIHRIDLKNLTSAPVKGDDAGQREHPDDRFNVVRARGPEPRPRPCSQGVNGVNSDVVMILT